MSSKLPTQAATLATPPVSTMEKKLSKSSAEVVEQCISAVIETDEDAGKAADLAKIAKKQIAALEEERKLIVKPLNDVIKHVNGRFKKLTDPLNNAVDILRSKVSEFLTMKDEAEKAARKTEADELRKEAESMRDIGDKAGAKEAVSTAKQIEESETGSDIVHGSVSSVHGRSEISWSIVDEKKIPRKYYSIDEKKIDADIRSGLSIPGVESKVIKVATFR